MHLQRGDKEEKHMDKPTRKKETKKDLKVPRTFMTPAYFEEVDTNTFGLYRDIVAENGEFEADGTPIREKWGKRIGPIFLCRIASKDEEPDYTTSRPDGTVLLLKKIANPNKESETGLPSP
jgi:hypothetical protein